MPHVEILLREDIEHLGYRGQIVRVKSGYARNFLLPRKLAVIATAANAKMIEQQREALSRREARERDQASQLADRLRTVTLEFERKLGEQGVFYGSVTTLDIAEALKAKGYEVERRKIHLSSPIKEPGEYDVQVKLHREVTLNVKTIARGEGGDAPPAAESGS
ncbi:MAG: 50S ribosomal protein L9 [Acidobacteria bacterium]|nr:50S ribosomal protein L9 [Acidobacteriota bacterium]